VQDTTNRVVASADVATREVHVRTLDEILANQNPALIKMDVEGYEPQVVAGASATLKKSSLLAVITETADPEIRSVLADNGFMCATYRPFERSISVDNGHGSSMSSKNTLFVRSNGLRERLELAPARHVVCVTV
jgi:hypothetical protein